MSIRSRTGIENWWHLSSAHALISTWQTIQGGHCAQCLLKVWHQALEPQCHWAQCLHPCLEYSHSSCTAYSHYHTHLHHCNSNCNTITINCSNYPRYNPYTITHPCHCRQDWRHCAICRQHSHIFIKHNQWEITLTGITELTHVDWDSGNTQIPMWCYQIGL